MVFSNAVLYYACNIGGEFYEESRQLCTVYLPFSYSLVWMFQRKNGKYKSLVCSAM